MAAGKYNIIIDRGSDFSETFVVKEAGVAKDLTLYSARAQLRTTKDAATVAATFTCNIPTPLGGVITMELGHALSTALTTAIYYWDLEIFTSGDASVTRLVGGEANLTSEVTR